MQHLAGSQKPLRERVVGGRWENVKDGTILKSPWRKCWWHTAKGVDNEGQSESNPPILGSGVEIQNYPCMRKNPDNLRHRHGWCSGSDILAQGCGRDHPDCKPMWASPPVQIPTFCWCSWSLSYRNMSSNNYAASLVPVLDGTNYRYWAVVMKALISLLECGCMLRERLPENSSLRTMLSMRNSPKLERMRYLPQSSSLRRMMAWCLGRSRLGCHPPFSRTTSTA